MKNLNHSELYCPVCKAKLRSCNDQLECKNCDLVYPVILGIVDLRYPRVALNRKELEMVSIFDRASFDDLLEILLQDVELPASILSNTYTYYQNHLERTEKMTLMFLQRSREEFSSPQKARALDLGCGAGAGLIALSKWFETVDGVDSSLAQLLLAKKYLEHHGMMNVCLVCANACALPYSAGTLSYIQAINVLEHVINLDKTLMEVSRCLILNGIFAADSRNRYDIFMPEPHTGLRFLGFLPRPWIPKFVRWICNSQYEQTCLLSFGELRRSLEMSFQGSYNIVFPLVQAYDLSSWMDDLLSLIERIPLIKKILIRIFPVHLVLSVKGNSE